MTMMMMRRNRSEFHTLRRVLFVLVAMTLTTTLMVSAFSTTSLRHYASSGKSSQRRQSRVILQSSPGADDFGALTSQLARLDQQFQIQQRNSNKPKSRWSKLFLPAEEEEEGDENAKEGEDHVWILEPPQGTTIPSCMIVFTGGAGLGQFPHIAYNELLSRISDKLNAVCISAPYQVSGLDHFGIAKDTGDRMRRALVLCQDDPARQYPANLPTYALSHSLGGKLQTIYLGATGQDYDGIGLISFNNFSFGQTISMVKEFASQLQETTGPASAFPNMGDNTAILNTVFSFAENLVTGMGVDFTPSPADTERLIQLRYNKDLQAKTRLFVLDDDNLDSSEEFVNLCSSSEDGSDAGPSVSGLPGGHLASVFLQLGLDDLGLDDFGFGPEMQGAMPFEPKTMAKEAMGGLESAAFGNESDLNGLVDEICDWILGKAPKRGANWDGSASNSSRQVPPRLAQGAPSDD
eukprot:CAMPEP_0113641282 /NCGR_PEP_ID=MMETSP0017_2-20120614/21670_1 /TAXON_ID=2856 /ORGANISM="Cylindrotheca closterium" /LENGTH=463 /DNA_ID=CAMNT_0000552613 /DNA_START=160 /DNA_END=1551 /DNA_ORIENTATION=+ /assembly_acc=CAM_ASM_000147